KQLLVEPGGDAKTVVHPLPSPGPILPPRPSSRCGWTGYYQPPHNVACRWLGPRFITPVKRQIKLHIWGHVFCTVPDNPELGVFPGESGVARLSSKQDGLASGELKVAKHIQ